VSEIESTGDVSEHRSLGTTEPGVSAVGRNGTSFSPLTILRGVDSLTGSGPLVGIGMSIL
jgi:hypothetical protein